ncbi:MAG: hypothetical protein PHE93_03170 [Clostridia bacterium]|nr:hypothetical protein [Clostridia bacterium]
MKKKIFEKILAIGSALVAVVFVIVLLVTMFGGIDAAEFKNSLVQGLFISLGIVYLLLSAGSIAYQFVDSDAVKEIVINTDKQTSTKATSGVIKKLAKQHIATVDGVKCTKVVISLTDYGVRLKVGIKVVDKEIQQVAAVLKCLLEDVYYETLGYKFYAIDFKVLSLKSTYASDMSDIEEKAKENVEAQKLACQEDAANSEEKIEEITQPATDDVLNDKEEVVVENEKDEVSVDKEASVETASVKKKLKTETPEVEEAKPETPAED